MVISMVPPNTLSEMVCQVQLYPRRWYVFDLEFRFVGLCLTPCPRFTQLSMVEHRSWSSFCRSPCSAQLVIRTSSRNGGAPTRMEITIAACSLKIRRKTKGINISHLSPIPFQIHRCKLILGSNSSLKECRRRRLPVLVLEKKEMFLCNFN